MTKKFFLLISTIALVLFPAISYAGPLDVANKKLKSAIGGTGLESNAEVSVGTVVRAILSLVGTIFLILTIYAGILWMTAQGAQEQIEKAQNIVSAAIIGLLITMAAYAITTFVVGRLGNIGQGNASATPTPTTQNTPQGSNLCADAVPPQGFKTPACVASCTGYTFVGSYGCSGNTPVCCSTQ